MLLFLIDWLGLISRLRIHFLFFIFKHHDIINCQKLNLEKKAFFLDKRKQPKTSLQENKVLGVCYCIMAIYIIAV